MAKALPEEKVLRRRALTRYLGVALVCFDNVDFRFLNKFLSSKIGDKLVLSCQTSGVM